MPGEEEEAKKDEQALGRLAMSAIRAFLKSPQGIFIAILSVYLGVTPLMGVVQGHGRSTRTPDMLAIIKDIRDNVVEIKITNKAILTTLPKAQRLEAERLISLQMQALAMMRVKDAP